MRCQKCQSTPCTSRWGGYTEQVKAPIRYGETLFHRLLVLSTPSTSFPIGYLLRTVLRSTMTYVASCLLKLLVSFCLYSFSFVGLPIPFWVAFSSGMHCPDARQVAA